MFSLVAAVATGAVAVFLAVMPLEEAPANHVQDTPPSGGAPAWAHVCLGMVSDPEWCQ